MSCIKKIVNRDEKANGGTLNEKSKKTQNFSQYIRRVTILQKCGTAPGLKRDKFRDYFTLHIDNDILCSTTPADSAHGRLSLLLVNYLLLCKD